MHSMIMQNVETNQTKYLPSANDLDLSNHDWLKLIQQQYNVDKPTLTSTTITEMTYLLYNQTGSFISLVILYYLWFFCKLDFLLFLFILAQGSYYFVVLSSHRPVLLQKKKQLILCCCFDQSLCTYVNSTTRGW